ncbi:MAG TPA: DUF3618 domain-containing protein [Candidatus Limnocylindrales bacterium]|jgi:ElaB/YqjD/DUF883 family membrane-anchored ribosome-binding protein
MTDDTTFDRDRVSGLDADPLTDDSFATASEEPEVEALVIDIATTRSEMSQTVDELGERLAPSAVADRAGEAVREATIGKIEAKVNDVTNAASDFATNAGQTAQEAGSGIAETIRRNPIPAAMAGIGLGWLWMNRQSGRTSWTSSRRPVRTSWAAADDGWRRADRTYDDRYDNPSIGDRARDVSSSVGDAADNARRAAEQRLDDIGTNASRAADQVGTTATQAVTQAQQAVESNPLAFGAIAVAVGTAIGLALPATQTEKRVMGDAGGRLIDQVESAVSQPLDEMSQKTS